LPRPIRRRLLCSRLLHKSPGFTTALSWIILDRLKDPAEREWYIRAYIQHGWSRAILEAQIETGLYRRQGAALTK
jgi:hypothetical protein